MIRFTFLVPALLLSACITDAPPSDIDDALPDDDASKADEIGAYRHYLLHAEPSADGSGTRWLSRAGGGALRCPDEVVRDRCEVTSADVLPTLGLRENPDVVFDELHEHAMIARGRLVRSEGRVYLRASALTRAITSVTPSGTCYRLRPRATAGNCPSSNDRCVAYDLEQLDQPVVEQPQVLYFDDVDPTPDFWGQPTPAVQAQVDLALTTAQTRPVYTCGELDRRPSADLWWANQVFAPAL